MIYVKEILFRKQIIYLNINYIFISIEYDTINDVCLLILYYTWILLNRYHEPTLPLSL